MGSQHLQREAILKRIAQQESLPSPSPLVLTLMEMASDETNSPAELARVVEQDPGLATRLIRLVNSAFYGARIKVSSIPRAIMMIGFNRLRMLALSISLRDTFPMGPVQGMDYEHFWKTSLYRALLAQALAKSLPLDETTPEEIFTTGLILEIGLPLLFHICPAELRASFPGGVVSLPEALAWEESHLGIHHREIGHIVLGQWHFPEMVVEQQMQFGPEALEAHRPLPCRIVEYARVAAQIFLGGRDDFGFLLEMAPSLGLEPLTVDQILASCFSVVESAAEQLRLKVNSGQDMLEVMEKANRALARINGTLETSLGRITARSKDWVEGSPESDAPREMILNAVAHEIRNPLMAIGGFARRIVQNAGEEGELSRYARIIVQESSRLERIVSGFSALSRPYFPVREPTDLVELVHAAIQEMAGRTSEGSPSVLPRFKRGQGLILALDAGEVSKAISRIAKTAFHALRQPGACVSADIHVSEEGSQVDIVLEIPEGTLPQRVRELVSRPETTCNPMELDFDLLFARKVIEAHGGRVSVNETGGLQTLMIRLPMERP